MIHVPLVSAPSRPAGEYVIMQRVHSYVRLVKPERNWRAANKYAQSRIYTYTMAVRRAVDFRFTVPRRLRANKAKPGLTRGLAPPSSHLPSSLPPFSVFLRSRHVHGCVKSRCGPTGRHA